ncbi:MAG: LamG-like jellyroll fold domain-containing protein [Bacilli bacterium]
MKKGFTLIELLAVIVIIGLVFTIAVPIVNHFIDEAALKTFNANAEAMREAAENYYVENAFQLPTDIGQKKSLNLNTLVSEGYIKELKNPRDESIECQGYVLVTRTHLTTVSYEPFLNCGASFQTVGYYDNYEISDGGLMAHYTFDDFQEPTENLLATVGVNATTDPTKWSHWYSGYWGVYEQYTDPTLGVVQKLTKNGATITSTYIYDYYPYTFYVNEVYTFSAMVRTNINFTKAISLYLVDSNGGQHTISVSYDGSHTKTINFIANEWQYVTFTVKVGEDAISTGGFGLNMGSGWENIIFEVAQPQFEKKTYATPFVNGIRTGVVEDVSGNDHDAPLTLDTTPRWINNSPIGGGAYEFNGTNNINLDFPLTGNNNYSMSLWIYRFNTFPSGDYNRFIGTQNWGVGRNGVMINNAGLLAVNTYFGSGYDYWFITTITPPFNEWFNVVVTYDRQGYQKIYYNGELAGSIDMSPAASINWASDNIYIACGATTGVYKIHQGRIDDVRIYNRILEDWEIEFNYDIGRPR